MKGNRWIIIERKHYRDLEDTLRFLCTCPAAIPSYAIPGNAKDKKISEVISLSCHFYWLEIDFKPIYRSPTVRSDIRPIPTNLILIREWKIYGIWLISVFAWYSLLSFPLFLYQFYHYYQNILFIRAIIY